jgi:hypothetical protein
MDKFVRFLPGFVIGAIAILGAGFTWLSLLIHEFSKRSFVDFMGFIGQEFSKDPAVFTFMSIVCLLAFCIVAGLVLVAVWLAIKIFYLALSVAAIGLVVAAVVYFFKGIAIAWEAIAWAATHWTLYHAVGLAIALPALSFWLYKGPYANWKFEKLKKTAEYQAALEARRAKLLIRRQT